MASFDDVRLPVDIETGAEGGPSFSTGIITTASGQEQRTQNWSVARNTYTIGYGTSESDWQAVRAFFYARRGRARGFRFKDWTDYQGVNEPLLIVGNYLYVTRNYTDDIGILYQRKITRIVPGTLRVHDAVQDFTALYNESYGRLTLKNGAVQPPPDGPLLADYEYDLPVRFDVDTMVLTAETIIAATLDGLTLVELIENSDTLNGG